MGTHCTHLHGLYPADPHQITTMQLVILAAAAVATATAAPLAPAKCKPLMCGHLSSVCLRCTVRRKTHTSMGGAVPDNWWALAAARLTSASSSTAELTASGEKYLRLPSYKVPIVE